MSYSVSAELRQYPIIRVIDGDTVVFRADFLPLELKSELSLRIWGVDTPEKGKLAKCSQEQQLSKKASEFTKNAVQSSRKQEIELRSWDKYGGRVLGDLYLDGVSLRVLLLKNNLAREYYGAKKQSWCK